MTKYDKELDTRTAEYEEATRPSPRDHRESEADQAQRKNTDQPENADQPVDEK